MNPVLTAVQGTNADLFPSVLKLYVPEGSRVLDMTYARGVFWNNVDTSKYDLIANDISPDLGEYHDDFRRTRWSDGEFDAVVLDPPYVSRSGSPTKAIIDFRYRNGERAALGIYGTERMMQYYREGMVEAMRILRVGGILIVKCMDEVMGGKQRMNHITLFHTGVDDLKLLFEDLFVLVQKGTPTMRHNHQLHARKNHSYFLVFRKVK